MYYIEKRGFVFFFIRSSITSLYFYYSAVRRQKTDFAIFVRICVIFKSEKPDLPAELYI